MRQKIILFLIVSTLIILTNCQDNNNSSYHPLQQQPDTQQCIDDLKSQTKLIQSLYNDIEKNKYKRIVDKLNDILYYFNQTISKCVDSQCWMNAQDICQNNTQITCEQINDVYYPICNQGYKIKDKSICVQECPSLFKESGLYCEKPDNYFRGFGYPWKYGDKFGSLDAARQRCQKDNSQGCEKIGAIIYPNCLPNFHTSGCCSCQPDCPNGMKDNGVSCMRKQYGRGFGYKDGQCIQDKWNNYTIITESGDCINQINTLKLDLSNLISLFNSQDSHSWELLKISYVMVQNITPFVNQCQGSIIDLDNQINKDNGSSNGNDGNSNGDDELSGLSGVIQIIFEVIRYILRYFTKE